MTLTREVLEELVAFDEATGEAFWKSRRIVWFNDSKNKKAIDVMKWWNSKNANKRAGTINKTNGYVQIKLLGKSYQAHRLFWFYKTGEWPEYIDHIDHNRSNNVWVNLRDVPFGENLKNRARFKKNKSGHTGVYKIDKYNKWRVIIKVAKRQHHVGYFSTFEQAIAAYERAKKVFGYHANHGK